MAELWIYIYSLINVARFIEEEDSASAEGEFLPCDQTRSPLRFFTINRKKTRRERRRGKGKEETAPRRFNVLSRCRQFSVEFYTLSGNATLPLFRPYSDVART